MNFQEVITYFEEIQDENIVSSNKRFAIDCEKSYGIRLPVIRKLAKEIGKDHDLAIELWNHPYHESHLLATMIDEKEKVTSKQLDEWVNSFYSWDIVDQACINLLVDLPQARKNIFVWCKSEKEFVKRTAFSLIAVIAVHDKNAKPEDFDKYFPLIKEASFDNRNFVKKSVNWALRQIGKSNLENNRKALALAYKILEIDCKASKWVARSAIRELESEKVRNKLS